MQEKLPSEIMYFMQVFCFVLFCFFVCFRFLLFSFVLVSVKRRLGSSSIFFFDFPVVSVYFKP